MNGTALAQRSLALSSMVRFATESSASARGSVFTATSGSMS